MIKEVILTRFKRFKQERFDVSGHVVLAGQNNCGKTTVLQAIAAWALALNRWRELGDSAKHKGAYSRKAVDRQEFPVAQLRSFDLLWHERSYREPIEIEVVYQGSEGHWQIAM